MAVKRLDIHPDALEEMKSALGWYLNRSETAAINFVSEFDHAIDLIVNAPDRWPQSANGTRKFVMNRFPFAIVYRETETTVQVVAVAHGHRRPGYWKKRL